jgi:hypothetical protein
MKFKAFKEKKAKNPENPSYPGKMQFNLFRALQLNYSWEMPQRITKLLFYSIFACMNRDLLKAFHLAGKIAMKRKIK